MGNKKSEKKPVKTREERETWVAEMKQKLMELGCRPAQFMAVREFFQIMDQYVEDGIGVTGKVDFPDCPPDGGREICYILTNSKHKTNTVHLLTKNRRLVKKESRTKNKSS